MNYGSEIKCEDHPSLEITSYKNKVSKQVTNTKEVFLFRTKMAEKKAVDSNLRPGRSTNQGLKITVESHAGCVFHIFRFTSGIRVEGSMVTENCQSKNQKLFRIFDYFSF